MHSQLDINSSSATDSMSSVTDTSKKKTDHRQRILGEMTLLASQWQIEMFSSYLYGVVSDLLFSGDIKQINMCAVNRLEWAHLLTVTVCRITVHNHTFMLVQLFLRGHSTDSHTVLQSNQQLWSWPSPNFHLNPYLWSLTSLWTDLEVSLPFKPASAMKVSDSNMLGLNKVTNTSTQTSTHTFPFSIFPYS